MTDTDTRTDMTYHILSPKRLHGTVNLPASKSISNRVLVIQALTAHGSRDTKFLNLADCDDTRVMRQWLESRPSVIDIGAAGTAMRFSTALLAVTRGTHLITGTERMRHRPIGILVNALRELGANVEYTEQEGFPPLRITGSDQLEGGMLHLRGDVSSQFISALLMIAPALRNGLTVVLEGNVVSRPYIDLTLSLMRDFGADARWTDERTIRVLPKPYQPRTFIVENDWSAASYWYEMMALSCGEGGMQQGQNTHAQCGTCDEIVLDGLFPHSLQGDSEVAHIFEQLGVGSESLDGNRIRLTVGAPSVARMDYDFVRVPDLAQTVIVTCCMKGIPFHFTGLQSLRIKETDRFAALQTELAKLNIHVRIVGDNEMSWDGLIGESARTDCPVVTIDTYDDHRMAMAFAPCALRLGNIAIRHPEVVTKSYPSYWQALREMNFSIAEE